MTQTSKFSTPRLLSSLEEVAKTRTPIWDEWSGDIRIKLDTDVNGQEWYVIKDNSILGCPFTGEVPCWAFPHFNGSHDSYSYVPVAFCFKTFASLLEEYPQLTTHERWHYNKEEYAERLEHANYQPEQIGDLDGEIEDSHAALTTVDNSTNGSTRNSALCIGNEWHNFKIHDGNEQLFRFCTKCGKISKVVEDENGASKWITVAEPDETF